MRKDEGLSIEVKTDVQPVTQASFLMKDLSRSRAM